MEENDEGISECCESIENEEDVDLFLECVVGEDSEVEEEDADFHEDGAVEVEEFGDPVPEHHVVDLSVGDVVEVFAETVVDKVDLEDDERCSGEP